MADQYSDPPMPADSTRNIMLLTSGFGIGALVVLFGFLFLVGIGGIGHNSVSPETPAAKSAAVQPTAPGPAPNPAPQTSTPQTTGQAPQPAQPSTPRAPQAGQHR
jgi:hypothetical protein